MAKMPNWSNEEVELLKTFYQKESRLFLEKMFPGRNFQGIQIKANKLGLHRFNYFTNDELVFIKENYLSMSYVKIGKMLGRTGLSVKAKARKIGLTRQEKWTKEEDDILKNNIGLFSVDYIKNNLIKNRTVSSIYHKIQEFELQEKTNRYNNLTNDDIINKMISLSSEIGRVPLSKELFSLGMPSAPVITERFSSYSNFCILCGLVPNTGYVGYTKEIDKRGEQCLSLSEKIISDFLFDNNVLYSKEVEYKEIIPSYEGKMRCDWLLPNNVIVEFFGMSRHKRYGTRMNKKIELCKDNNIQLIELYEKDLLNNKYKEILNPFLK